MENDIKSNLNR